MAPAMWTYFGIAILGYLVSMFVKEKEIKIFKLNFKLNQFLVLLIGLSWIIAGISATLLAAVQTGNYFNTPLVGHNVVDLGGHYEADTYSNFLPGYYLIYASGLVALITALFYNKILGHKVEK
jgi:multisubunit Na+/H+ antiporter MnhB subunit